MKVEFTKAFQKVFKRRFSHLPSIRQKLKERTEFFEANPYHPLLRNHELEGEMRSYWAFSVTGDIRVVYYIDNDIAYFVDIGTHNQVY